MKERVHSIAHFGQLALIYLYTMERCILTFALQSKTFEMKMYTTLYSASLLLDLHFTRRRVFSLRIGSLALHRTKGRARSHKITRKPSSCVTGEQSLNRLGLIGPNAFEI